MSVEVLVLEDSELDAELTKRALLKSDIDCNTTCIQTKEELRESMADGSPDIVLSDFDLRTFTGDAAFQIVREVNDEIPFILVSGKISKEMEVRFLEGRITDVVLKDNISRLPFAVKRALNEYEDRKKLKSNLEAQETLSEISIIFNSPLYSVKEKIDAAIRMIGLTTNASRVFIFQDFEGGRKSRIIHDWISPYFDEVPGEIKKVVYDKDLPNWRSLVQNSGAINIADLDKLSSNEFRSELQSLGIKALLVYPIMIENSSIGFIGMSDTQKSQNWPKYIVDMLKTVSGFISNGYKEELYKSDLEEKNKELCRSLNEKQELLSEIHHRVKNNLAIITSFLELERYKNTDPLIFDILEDQLMRIKCISIVQEHFYQTETLSKIEIGETIKEVFKKVFLYSTEKKLDFEIIQTDEQVYMNVNQVMPLTLLLAEIFIQIFKNKKISDRFVKSSTTVKYGNTNRHFTIYLKNEVLPEYLETERFKSDIFLGLMKQLEAELEITPDPDTVSIVFEKKDVKGSTSSIS